MIYNQSEAVKKLFIWLWQPNTLLLVSERLANIHFLSFYAQRSFTATLKIWKREKSTQETLSSPRPE